MLNLPFVVQPRRQPELVRIGSDELGIFEIERRGYLTVGEKSAYQQIEKNKEGVHALRQLIGKVAQAENMSDEQAHDLVLKVLRSEKLTVKQEKIANKYTSDFVEVLAVFTQEALHTQLIQATVLLISRVNPDTTFEDTANLDPEIIEQLSALFLAEETRSRDALNFNVDEVTSGEEPEPGKQMEASEKTE